MAIRLCLLLIVDRVTKLNPQLRHQLPIRFLIEQFKPEFLTAAPPLLEPLMSLLYSAIRADSGTRSGAYDSQSIASCVRLGVLDLMAHLLQSRKAHACGHDGCLYCHELLTFTVVAVSYCAMAGAYLRAPEHTRALARVLMDCDDRAASLAATLLWLLSERDALVSAFLAISQGPRLLFRGAKWRCRTTPFDKALARRGTRHRAGPSGIPRHRAGPTWDPTAQGRPQVGSHGTEPAQVGSSESDRTWSGRDQAAAGA